MTHTTARALEEDIIATATATAAADGAVVAVPEAVAGPEAAATTDVATQVGTAATDDDDDRTFTLSPTNRRTVLRNCETHILDKKSHGTWDTTAILNTLSTRFAVELAKVDHFSTQLGEVLKNEEVAKNAKKELGKEAVLALFAAATGPFSNVAKDVLKLSYEAATVLVVESIAAATMAGQTARTYDAGEHTEARVATNPLSLNGKLANQFVDSLREARDTYLDKLASKASLDKHVDDAVAAFEAAPGEELTASDFRDSIESTVKSVTSKEIRSYETRFKEARKQIGDDLEPPKADMAIKYAGVIAKACCQPKKAVGLYDRNYSVTEANIKAATKKAGTTKKMGAFLTSYLKEFKRSEEVDDKVYRDEPLQAAFPHVTQEDFHLNKTHKRANMIAALKVLHSVVGTKPMALRTPAEKKEILGKLLKIALSTPEFNHDHTKASGKKGQKVNPLGWLLRNTEVGAELTRDIPAHELRAIVAEAKTCGSTSPSRVRTRPTWKEVALTASRGLGKMAPPAGAIQTATACVSPRRVC